MAGLEFVGANGLVGMCRCEWFLWDVPEGLGLSAGVNEWLGWDAFVWDALEQMAWLLKLCSLGSQRSRWMSFRGGNLGYRGGLQCIDEL